MAENLFTDYKDRVDILKNHCDLKKQVFKLEEAFGEKDAYKTEEEAMEFYMGALDELGRYCAKELKPTAREIDTIGAKFVDGKVVLPELLLSHLKKLADLGIFAGQASRAQGGFNMPNALQVIALEMFGQACPNTGLTIAAFSMVSWFEKWATDAQKASVIPKFLLNEWQTAMALTEPNAGSDLGKLRTTGVRKGDKFIINGTKQFITNGDGDIVFTLARTDPNSKGLEGLSVLLVPKMIDGKLNVKVAKIEDKICLHASPTCELVYENSIGELFGPENQGFKVMLDLMNAARLAMSALALGICSAALEEAKSYANQRVTMGKPIVQHPMVADMIYEMDVEIRAMRSLVVEAACAFDWMRIHEKLGNVKEFKRWRLRYRRLTPLCKYMISEKAITITRNAMQIFGGYGVCKDYSVERLVRESLIYPIYEGTSQIQSLMNLKDTMKDVATQATGFLGSLAGAWAESKIARDPIKSQLLQARNELNQGIKTILMTIIKDKFKADIEALKQNNIQQFIKEFSLKLFTEKTDLTYPFFAAERFTRITCDYYALKSMCDHRNGDEEWDKWILDFAGMALPRMANENAMMISRYPYLMNYMKSGATAPL